MTLSDDLTAAAIEAEKLEAELVAAQNSLTLATDMIAEKNEEIADLQQKLDDCEGTEPIPEPVLGTAWGMGSFRILSGNSSSELDPYRGKTPAQFYDTLQTEIASLSPGAKMTAVRVYAQDVATNYGSTDAAWVPPGSMPVLSLKGDDAQMANGSYDDELLKLVTSWPSDIEGYLIWNHERDNDTDALANPQGVMAVHRKALARFAWTVLSDRGTKDITPACCPTGWNLDPRNTNYPSDVLNPKAELETAGVSLDDFCFMLDTYYRKPPTAKAVTDFQQPIIKRVKGWGFTRVGIGELGVDTYPSANRTPGAEFITAWSTMADAEDLEVVCWYESGGGDKAPAQGWFIYGNAAKTAWGKACS